MAGLPKCKICGKTISAKDKEDETKVVKKQNGYYHVSCLNKKEKSKEVKNVVEINNVKEEKVVTTINDTKDDIILKMQEQLNALTMAMSMMGNKQGNVVLEQNKDLTRSVKVTSLLPNAFYLSSEKYGRGETFEFHKIGDTNIIPFTVVQKILAIHKSQFEKGYAILESEKDYKDLGVSYIYGTVLNEEKLAKIISLKEPNCIDVILELDEGFQEKIAITIAENISNGIEYDQNKIEKLEQEGFDIRSLANELKEEKEAKKEDKVKE